MYKLKVYIVYLKLLNFHRYAKVVIKIILLGHLSSENISYALICALAPRDRFDSSNVLIHI